MGRQGRDDYASDALSRVRGTSALSDPLVRTAWPLLLNTVSNAVLGVGYWLAAARLFDARTVATNAAVIAAMTTISGVTQLNLGQALPVLVPRAGAHARSVILRVYVVVTCFAVVVLLGFVGLVLPHLDRLSHALDAGDRLWAFGCGVLLLNVFALQDSALLSLRRQALVPVENAVFGATKIVLLFPLAALAPSFGIFVSWVLPMLVLVPAITAVVLRSRAGDGATHGSGRLEDRARLALEYLGYIFQVGSTVLLPVVALELLEPVQAAIFAVCWQTSSTIDLLATNVGMSLMVETSYGHDPRALRRTALTHGLLLVGTVAMVGVLVAPLVLRLYGADYVDGADTLRLLLLAGVPRALVTFAVSEARAHRTVGFIVTVRLLSAVIGLGLAFPLADRYGVTGMALAWLAAQLVCASVALSQVRRELPTVTEEAR